MVIVFGDFDDLARRGGKLSVMLIYLLPWHLVCCLGDCFSTVLIRLSFVVVSMFLSLIFMFCVFSKGNVWMGLYVNEDWYGG